MTQETPNNELIQTSIPGMRVFLPINLLHRRCETRYLASLANILREIASAAVCHDEIDMCLSFLCNKSSGDIIVDVGNKSKENGFRKLWVR